MEVPPNDGSSMSKRKNPNGTDDDRGYPYDLGTPPTSRQKDLLGKNGCCNLIGTLDLLLKMGHFENKWLPAHVGSGKCPNKWRFP